MIFSPHQYRHETLCGLKPAERALKCAITVIHRVTAGFSPHSPEFIPVRHSLHGFNEAQEAA